jgi:glycerol-3-phosphate acyltransferase PlsX
MRIGIDIMGGDYAPEVTVLGAILALKEITDNDRLVLIGDERWIHKILNREDTDPCVFDIVHTNEVIEMGDHPAKSYAQKTNSSISIGYELLKNNEIEGFASAGNTGAMLVGLRYTVKVIPGIIRPTIASSIPTVEGKPTIFLDVGINPDCRPDVLYQYAILGSLYAEHVWDIDNPRVGLLNIGSEETKGNLVSRSTYELMKGTRDFNFIGNIEGNDFFSNEKADVVVCDGFVGNVILKEAEAFYTMVKSRKIKDEFFERFNFENYGGTPILGINSNVVIGHGISNEIAIKNMILHTRGVIHAKLTDKIKEVFK